ncbi:MAG TPA: peptidoglycan binding domain-containing protein, partial [Polyangiales bacterium]|nr:peptidoglycan binding domain-containing protein [Polyangiales bacterium]
MPIDDENAESAPDLPAESARKAEREARELAAADSRERAKPRAGVISLGRFAIGGLACLPLVLFALMFARFSSSERVLSGVSVAGVEVGGASRSEVERLLQQHAAQLAREPLKLQLGERQAAASLEELGVALDAPASASRALGVARSASWFSNALRYLAAVGRRESLGAETRVDRARFAAALDQVAPKLIEDAPLAGCVRVEDGVAAAIAPRSGRKLDVESSRRAVTEAVAQGRSQVTLSAITVTPELAP